MSSLYDGLELDPSEIRLLEFSTIKLHTGEISYCLSKHTLDSTLVYSTLSYVWADGKNITINGLPFAVTTNLLAFLRIHATDPVHDCPQGVKSLLWVDAICINQRHPAERNEQVRMMGDIYRNATVVLAWLGPAEDNSTECVKLIKYLGHTIREYPQGDIQFLLNPAPQLCPEGSNFDLIGKNLFKSEPWWISDAGGDQNDDLANQWAGEKYAQESLLMLCFAIRENLGDMLDSRVFWERAWILQELVLSKQLVFFCGTESFTYNEITCISTWVGAILPE